MAPFDKERGREKERERGNWDVTREREIGIKKQQNMLSIYKIG